MTSTAAPVSNEWIARLSKQFAERAANFDETGQFVKQNFEDLKSAGAFGWHVPTEFGGSGASYTELCDTVRQLAHGCSSTALAYSMHSHLIAAVTWRWLNQKAPVEGLLKRVAAEQLVLISSGGSDWLNGSGTAEKVEGGYKFSARKIFASASPIGDLLMTMAVTNDPVAGPTVLHFPISFKSPEVKVLNNWRVLGMRGTGSNDVEIKDLFVPDSAIAVRRPQGQWHPAMHVVSLIAFPLIYAAYMGVAEAAREIAVRKCAKKKSNQDTQMLVGEMDNELTAARLAWNAMVNLGQTGAPNDATTAAMMTYRTLLAPALVRTVEKAMRAVGGASFYQSLGLERLFRDIQGANFHPLQDKPQARLAGRFALGLPL